MSYSIRIERDQDGRPVIAHHGGELPGIIVVSGHQDGTIQQISAALIDNEEHQVLAASAQRPRRDAERF